MSKLNIISPKDMIRIIEKLNFEEIRQNGSHKFFRHKDGRATVIPMHSNDLKRGLIKQILKDIKITDEEYEELRKSI
ncbi:MAG: type II toxin-antitoxin system HicA family toxin [Lutispora sp.]|nr:type II toxin-antitoxin system HicA family toxin [Lutispora sp.]